MRLVPLLAVIALSGCIFVVDRGDDPLADDGTSDDTDRPRRPGPRTDTDDADTDRPAARACDSDAIRALIADLVSQPGKGCGEATFAVAAERDAGELVLRVDLATAGPGPHEVGERYEVDLADGSPGAMVKLSLGAGQYDAICNDVVTGDEVSWQTWVGTAGTLTLEVTGVDDGGFFATIAMEDVELVDAAHDTCHLPDAAWEEVFLGWLPG